MSEADAIEADRIAAALLAVAVLLEEKGDPCVVTCHGIQVILEAMASQLKALAWRDVPHRK
ncbi:MAG: hypothetical protein K5Q68_22085 [Roseococcus sp.]|nr:hypothetical protein [Roseococcus sp.]